MPIPFERFRFLNGAEKRIENVDYVRPLRVRVDDKPEIVVLPGETVVVPDGGVIEVVAEGVD